MTENEYEDFCKTTEKGTALTFHYGDDEIRGNFVGCAEDAVLIEVNGRVHFWQRELIDFKKSPYPSPSYS